MDIQAVAKPGSSRVHAAGTRKNSAGQFEPVCGRVKPWLVLKTEQPVNCRKCLEETAA